MMTDIMTIMEQKFTSGNSVSVTMSCITSDEYQQLKDYVQKLEDENNSFLERVDVLDEHNERMESNIKWLGKMVDELEKENNDLRSQLITRW